MSLDDAFSFYLFFNGLPLFARLINDLHILSSGVEEHVQNDVRVELFDAFKLFVGH